MTLILAGCGQQATHHHSKEASTPSTYQTKHATRQSITSSSPVRSDHKTENSDSSGNSYQDGPTHSPTNGLDLGHGVIGHEDRGAGQVYLQFKMGKWTVTVQGNDINQSSNSAQKKARSIVTWAQNHTLPIPRTKGELRVTTDNLATLDWDSTSGSHHLHDKLAAVLQQAINKHD